MDIKVLQERYHIQEHVRWAVERLPPAKTDPDVWLQARMVFLRILRVLDPMRSGNGLSSRPLSQHNTASERVQTGPGGAVIEAGSNLWTSSGLKMDSASNDVVWGRGNFDNKIVTGAMNGEIIYWDINKTGLKYETRVREHKRTVNKLAMSPFLPYLIASGSQDGYLRLWDLRTPPASSMKVYHPTPIRALALCPVPSNPLTVCTGLVSGNIQRWDLRNKASPIERIILAHSSSVLSMDWQLPSMRETGLGWLVTSGMDHSVKIWDLCLPSGTTIPANATDRDALLLNKRMGPRPFRTLHTAFSVRNVCWRPGYDTEVAVVSNNDSDAETVEVWDIRRGWISKWALNGAEGGITDIAFANSHTLWAQHANGTFAQHDLRDSYRPLDAIPRVAMTWTASGNLAFVANEKPAVELPYDDVDPIKKSMLHELRLRPKATSDPMFVPFQQTLGVHNVPTSDPAAFARLAKSYVFEGDKIWVCHTNAEAAIEAGQYRSAQTWLLLLAQLTDLRGPSSPLSVNSLALPSHTDAPRPSFSPANGSVISASPSEPRAPSRASHHTPSSQNPGESRPTSSSPMSADRVLSNHGQDTPPSSSGASSPPLRAVPLKADLPMRPWLNTSPTSLYDAPLASPRGTSSRRASTALPETPRLPRPTLRRASMSTPGAGSSSPASDSIKARGRAQVGEGALDDSDSESDSDGQRSGSRGGGETVSEPIPRPARGIKALPSPLSKLLVSREDSPDGHLAGDEYDSDVSHSPRSTSSESASESSPRTSRSSRSPQRSTVAIHRVLSKQESRSSIRTVIAPPSDPPSAKLRPLPEEEVRAAVMLNSEGQSTRRPSPTPGLGLGLSNMDEHHESTHAQLLPDGRLSDVRKQEILAVEARLREIGWIDLRDALEWFADKGDVQMCAFLAIVVPEELGIGAGRAARFVEAYLDLLSRMRLHAPAAHIRKYAQHPSVRQATQIQTTLYTSCGQCRRPIKPGVGGTLCHECRAPPTLCAVCHLPSRTLLLHCAICGHSAHLKCFRTFYLARPSTPLPTRTAHLPEDSSSSGSGSMSTMYYSLSEETEAEDEDSSRKEEEVVEVGEAKTRTRMRVLGRACAAGCGHYCWAASRSPP